MIPGERQLPNEDIELNEGRDRVALLKAPGSCRCTTRQKQESFSRGRIGKSHLANPARKRTSFPPSRHRLTLIWKIGTNFQHLRTVTPEASMIR